MSEKTIFFKLKAAGLTSIAAAAFLGNWQAESGVESNRVQGDFEAGREKSKRYTEQVDSGFISRWTFAHDEKGYGLAQWTYFSRKENLHKFAKARGTSVGDENAQVDFALHELKTEGEYRGLYDYLKTTDNLYEATERICTKYERPFKNNIGERYKYAQGFYERLNGTDPSPDPDPNPSKSNEEIAREVIADMWGRGADRRNRLTAAGYDYNAIQRIVGQMLKINPDGKYWPPRVLSRGMEGDDVFVWQALMIARGYPCNAKGIFDKTTEDASKDFQTGQGQQPTGIIESKAWDAALMH